MRIKYRLCIHTLIALPCIMVKFHGCSIYVNVFMPSLFFTKLMPQGCMIYVIHLIKSYL